MTCPFCKRDVETIIAADNTPIEITKETCVFLTISSICPDCLAVAKHFLAKGLLAFGKSMHNLRGQIDMFPGDLFVARDDAAERHEI